MSISRPPARFLPDGWTLRGKTRANERGRRRGTGLRRSLSATQPAREPAVAVRKAARRGVARSGPRQSTLPRRLQPRPSRCASLRHPPRHLGAAYPQGLRSRSARMPEVPGVDAGRGAFRRSPGRAAHPRAPGALGAAAHRARTVRARARPAARCGHSPHLSPRSRHRVVRREAKLLPSLPARDLRTPRAEKAADENRCKRRARSRKAKGTTHHGSRRAPKGACERARDRRTAQAHAPSGIDFPIFSVPVRSIVWMGFTRPSDGYLLFAPCGPC